MGDYIIDRNPTSAPVIDFSEYEDVIDKEPTVAFSGYEDVIDKEPTVPLPNSILNAPMESIEELEKRQ